jgi:hypothetical protein
MGSAPCRQEDAMTEHQRSIELFDALFVSNNEWLKVDGSHPARDVAQWWL